MVIWYFLLVFLLKFLYPKRTSRKIRVVPEKLKGRESYHTWTQRCAITSIYEVNPLHNVTRTGVSRHFTRDGRSQSFMTTYPTARTACRSISVPATFLKSSSLKELSPAASKKDLRSHLPGHVLK